MTAPTPSSPAPPGEGSCLIPQPRGSGAGRGSRSTRRRSLAAVSQKRWCELRGRVGSVISTRPATSAGRRYASRKCFWSEGPSLCCNSRRVASPMTTARSADAPWSAFTSGVTSGVTGAPGADDATNLFHAPALADPNGRPTRYHLEAGSLTISGGAASRDIHRDRIIGTPRPACSANPVRRIIRCISGLRDALLPP